MLCMGFNNVYAYIFQEVLEFENQFLMVTFVFVNFMLFV